MSGAAEASQKNFFMKKLFFFFFFVFFLILFYNLLTIFCQWKQLEGKVADAKKVMSGKDE